eukprot:1608755-Rhodomonas_salina.2
MSASRDFRVRFIRAPASPQADARYSSRRTLFVQSPYPPTTAISCISQTPISEKASIGISSPALVSWEPKPTSLCPLSRAKSANAHVARPIRRGLRTQRSP